MARAGSADLPDGGSEIFFSKGVDEIFTRQLICPSGQRAPLVVDAPLPLAGEGRRARRARRVGEVSPLDESFCGECVGWAKAHRAVPTIFLRQHHWWARYALPTLRFTVH